MNTILLRSIFVVNNFAANFFTADLAAAKH